MLIDDNLIGVIGAISYNHEKIFTSYDATLFGKLATVAAVIIEQNRRLTALELLHTASEFSAPITEDEKNKQKIITSINKLTDVKPHKLDKIARILSLIQELSL